MHIIKLETQLDLFPFPSLWLFLHLSSSFFIQMGANIKKFLRLVEDFLNMIGMQMSGFQDINEVTENLGES